MDHNTCTMSVAHHTVDSVSSVSPQSTTDENVYRGGVTEGTMNERRIVNATFLGNGDMKYETRMVPELVKRALIEHYTGDILHSIGIASAQTRVDICMKLLRIVLALHEEDIIHGSVCAANVKLNSNGDVTLTNAGLFPEIQRQAKQVPLLPCACCRSKEELEKDKYIPSKTADIYSLTVLFYSIFSGEEPYSSIPLVQVVAKIARVGHTALKRPAMMPPALWSPLEAYWKASFEGRKEAFGKVQAALV